MKEIVSVLFLKGNPNMKRKNFVLLFLAVILAVGSLIALSRDERTENVLPEDGILLCEIEGKPYYYNAEYLFKVTGQVFPEEPSVYHKNAAVFCELAYMESVASDAYVTSDRMEQEIKSRKNNAKAAEEILADPERDDEGSKLSEEYLAMLNTCAEKEGTTPNVFWDDVAPYVEKGILIEMYLGEPFPAFDREITVNETDFTALMEKYNVEIADDDLK